MIATIVYIKVITITGIVKIVNNQHFKQQLPQQAQVQQLSQQLSDINIIIKKNFL